MKKLALLIVCLLCFVSASLAAPAAPQMSYSLNGTNITVDWSTVPDANGYTLFYAAYPYHAGDTIYSMDNGNSTTFSIDLWDGAAYYIAVSAGNAQGDSGYSNVEYFIMKDHELEWEDKTAMGSDRAQFAGGVIDGKVYVFGGFTDSRTNYSSDYYLIEPNTLNTLEIFEPETSIWRAGSSNYSNNGSGVADLSSAVYDEKLFVFGATSRYYSSVYGIFLDNCTTVNFVEVYDPVFDKWSSLPQKPTSVNNALTVLYNDEIYLFGGVQWIDQSFGYEYYSMDRSNGTCTRDFNRLYRGVEAFNPTTGTWRSVTPMPEYQRGATIAVYDDKAYIFGGMDSQGNFVTQVIAYDFINDEWITSGLGSLNTPRLFQSNAAAPVVENTIILVGGWVQSNDMARTVYQAQREVESDLIELYSPRTHTAMLAGYLPRATAGHLSIVVDGELLVVGGISLPEGNCGTNNCSVPTPGSTNAVWKTSISSLLSH